MDHLQLLKYAIKARDYNREGRIPFRNQSHGCAAVTKEDGLVFYRGNVEVKSARFSLCAEQLTMADIKLYPNKQSIDLMVICGDGLGITCPCGICLQMMADFSNFSIMLSNNDGSKTKLVTSKELMPYAY